MRKKTMTTLKEMRTLSKEQREVLWQARTPQNMLFCLSCGQNVSQQQRHDCAGRRTVA